MGFLPYDRNLPGVSRILAGVMTRAMGPALGAAVLLAACADGTGPRRAVLSISAGAFHACAITSDHRAWCWGRNAYGALGDGTTGQRMTPVRVAIDQPFDSISAGYEYTCALGTDGSAWCWGENFGGQLGDGSAENRLVPVRVVAQERFRSISAGEAHTCAIGVSGTAYCWGAPLASAPDGSNPPDEHLPVAVGLPFTQVSSGYEIACALAPGGAPWCWGLLVPGIRFADTTQLSTNAPAAVEANGLTFATIGAGTKHACGLTAGGAAWCWGLNLAGQLGDGTTTSSLTPVPVSGGHAFAFLSAHSPAHACALTAAGEAWCWGANTVGALGDGTRAGGKTPVAVSGGLRFATLATGFLQSCGIDLAGDAWCWGYGGDGELGTGDSTVVTSPRRVLLP